MAENFTNFIIKLAEDPTLLSEFHKDPDATAQRAQLSAAEVAIFRSRNTKLIREAIVNEVGMQGAGGEAAGVTVVVLTWTRMPSSVTLDLAARSRSGFESRLYAQLGDVARGGTR